MRVRLFGLFLTLSTVIIGLPGLSQDLTDSKKVLAKVDGSPIRVSDVTEKSRDIIENLDYQKVRFEAQQKRERYQATRNALDTLIEAKLLTKEARARNMSIEALIAQEIDAKVERPSVKRVDEEFERQKNKLRGSVKEGKARIREYLILRDRQQAGKQFIQALKKKYPVESYLPEYRVDLVVDNQPVLGSENAPIEISVFSSFHCPLCAQLEPDLHKLLEFYPDDIKLVFYQFPNSSEPSTASEACLCAHEQGKFAEMSKALFADQKNLKDEDILKRAEECGLGVNVFKTCLKHRRYLGQIRVDQGEGARVGVIGTPTLFVNGRYLYGSLSFDKIARVIDDELEVLAGG